MNPPQASAAADHAGALREVWKQHGAGVLMKVRLLEDAIAAIGSAEFDDRLRGEARRSAHMLSGSLGMFGFTQASEAARELESELAQAVRLRASKLVPLVATIRRELGE